MKTIIVGGGAAGMLAAIEAAGFSEVILIEKMPRLGTKLSITGKGRCNLTNDCEPFAFFEQVMRNPKFMKSAFAGFDNKQVMRYFEKLGLSLKVERGKRVFPQSDKAIDVVAVLQKELRERQVKVLTNTKVAHFYGNHQIGGVILSSGAKIEADAVILATGGKSYPGTGSTGDGYGWLLEKGFEMVEMVPALVPLEAEGLDFGAWMGLSLKNVGFKIMDANGKVCFSEMGEMLFTHFGLSGPMVLTASSKAFGIKKNQMASSLSGFMAEIDFKPALSLEMLSARFQREMQEQGKKSMKNVLGSWLPQRAIETVLNRASIDVDTRMCDIKKEARQALFDNLKHFRLPLKRFRPIEEAIITRGGLSTKALNPKTMETKDMKGLFVCGELIDVDALTGGFNLQIAFSTGMAAARGVAAYYAENSSN